MGHMGHVWFNHGLCMGHNYVGYVWVKYVIYGSAMGGQIRVVSAINESTMSHIWVTWVIYGSCMGQPLYIMGHVGHM